MRQIFRAIAFFAALLPGYAAAQCGAGAVPAGTVLGRLGVNPGPCQAIPFATLLSNMGSVAATRIINTTAPLTGGGSLANDLTLGITLGTGAAAALATNVGSAGAFVLNGGALGTPSTATLTNATGLPISTGLVGAGTGILASFAANVGSAGAPVLFNGALGTPTSGVGTNLTGTAAGFTAGTVTTNANLTGPVTSVGNATTIGVNQVARNNLAQGTGLSVIGNATSSAANDGDIVGTADQALVVNHAATALAFGTVAVLGGGTGDTGTAWTDYTPTMACSSGSGTWSVTNKGHYKTLGKTVWIAIELTLTTLSTCSGSFTFTLPFTAQAPLTMLVRETGVTGNAYQAYAASTATVGTVIGMTNNALTLASGDLFIASGVYESQ